MFKFIKLTRAELIGLLPFVSMAVLALSVSIGVAYFYITEGNIATDQCHIDRVDVEGYSTEFSIRQTLTDSTLHHYKTFSDVRQKKHVFSLTSENTAFACEGL